MLAGQLVNSLARFSQGFGAFEAITGMQQSRFNLFGVTSHHIINNK